MAERNRVAAAIYGAAVGDILGATWEFLPPARIPQKGRLKVQGGGPFEWRPGAFTDDTDLLLVAGGAYQADGSWNVEAFRLGILDWFSRGPKDVGGQTFKACMTMNGGQFLGHDEEAQGNGGLMRAAVHGLTGASSLEVMRAAATDTYLTHPSDLTSGLSAVYAAILSDLTFRGQIDWRATVARLPNLEVLTGVRAVLAEPYAPDEPAPAKMGGWSVHTLRLALWALDVAESYADGIQAVIRSGGDTDTNAAVAGALLGAKFGLGSIPKAWISPISTRDQARLAAVIDPLAALADRARDRTARFGWDAAETGVIFDIPPKSS